MAQKNNHLSRRAYLKTLGAGALGGACMGLMQGCDSNAARSASSGSAGQLLNNKREEPATVSLVKGDDRREIVYQSMMNLKNEIVRAIGRKKVLIKPNMVIAESPNCETDPDAVRAVLDFIRDHTRAEAFVGESTADRQTQTMACFEQYGYFPVRDEYKVDLVDLNKEPCERRFILGENNKPNPISVISAFLDPDVFVISVPRMKVHSTAYVTLSLKNVLMAAPQNDYSNPELDWMTGDKYAMHVTPSSGPTDPLFYNLFLLSQHAFPDLAVIDGFEGMSDRGPMGGRMVDSHVAVTSLDALAADVTGTRVMGLDPDIVPYFNFIKEAGLGQGDPGKINTIGTPLDDCIYQFNTTRRFSENTAAADIQGMFHSKIGLHSYET